MNEPTKTRSVEREITIDAPVATVWSALTQPSELARWFPLEARGDPEPGGVITVSWGHGVEWGGTIAVWDPPRHLQLVTESGAPADEAPPVAVDYFLSTAGGQTVVRLVQSGFSADSAWDEFVEAVGDGWRYFLFNLKHYLERHPGVPRDMIWVRRPTKRPRAEGNPEWHCGFWLSTYGVEPQRVTRLRRVVSEMADRLLGPVAAPTAS